MPIKAMQVQHLRSVSSDQFAEIAPDINSKDMSGIYMNYEAIFSSTERVQQAAGVQSINYFRPKGTLTYDVFARSGPSSKVDDKFVRLDTYWTSDNVDKLAQWRIGDLITKAADWSGSTRAFGFQYASNFSVRPDLITRPLLNFQGEAQLPSLIDVYVNNINIYKGDLSIGAFDINEIPANTGKGELVVTTQDITGKLQTYVIPYYSTPLLLQKGIADFSFEMGFQRQRFGSISNEYKNLLTSATYMYGINDNLTSGIHFDSLNRDIASIGNTTYVKLGLIGAISASVATNITKFKKAQKFMLGYSYQQPNFSAYAAFTTLGQNFSDTYSYPASTQTKPSFSTGMGIPTSYGNFELGYSSFNNDTDKLRNITLAYNKPITRGITLRFSTGRNLNNKKDYFAALSLIFSYKNLSVFTENAKQAESVSQNVSFNQSAGQRLGWSAKGSISKQENKKAKQKTTNYDMTLDKKTPKGNITFNFLNRNKKITKQVSLAGSISMLEGDFFFAQPITDAFVLVKVGPFKDVPVYYNNQIVSRTNAKGNALISNANAYTRSEVSLDSETLPFDIQFSSLDAIVSPKAKSGVLINFGVKRIRSLDGSLVDGQGVPLPLNSIVNIEGLKQEEYIGYDGKLYIVDIQD